MASPNNTALPLPNNLWLHGLIMLVLVLLVNLAQTVLGLCATLQFFWMLFARSAIRASPASVKISRIG